MGILGPSEEPRFSHVTTGLRQGLLDQGYAPVSAGIVGSLARPGRNMTGMTFEYPELSGKRLEILKELAPRARRILALVDPRDASPLQSVAAARQAATGLGFVLVAREVRSPQELSRGLEALGDVDAVLGIPGGLPSAHAAEIIRRAHARRLPTIFPARTAETDEAVVTYGLFETTGPPTG